jgi:hypothetical protein
MKQISIEMPLVETCLAAECAYNTHNKCHAKAITVGDGVHPGCDTYLGLNGGAHSSAQERRAGVGACKVGGCEFNEDFECMAEQIAVGSSGNGIGCLTFRGR